MERTLQKELNDWRTRSPRYPLLLRGARQVGKSYLIEQFSTSFSSFHSINFEAQPEAIACFETLDPLAIIQKLELLSKQRIIPGSTLLFLDEIQACPKAILALRYFKEKLPELHVIGAGSLLEFALREGKFSFPVGRVQFVYLHPISFQEFLKARKVDTKSITPQNPPSDEVHQQLIQCTREYFLIGGMPAVVDDFIQKRSFLESTRIQDILLTTYRADFAKYATTAEQKYLHILFDRIPTQISQHFKYSEIDPHMKSRDLKFALEQLQQAGLISLIYSTSASGIPLASQVKFNKFKPLFLDIGLMQRALQVDANTILSKDLVQIHTGALAEQFVGQELIAYADAYKRESLFFWEREKKSSSAQVDYVISWKDQIIPIEVKGGAYGHLKSLMQFMTEKQSLLGIRISQNPLSFKNKILSVPFYMIHQLPHLIEESVSAKFD